MNININENSILLYKKLFRKRAIIYLAFVYGFVLISWILSIIRTSYSVLLSFFSFFPLLSNFLLE